MRSVHRRPGAFAILVPSPGFLLLETFLAWQAFAALGRGRSLQAGQESLFWAALALAAALLGLMFRWGDRVEQTRAKAES